MNIGRTVDRSLVWVVAALMCVALAASATDWFSTDSNTHYQVTPAKPLPVSITANSGTVLVLGSAVCATTATQLPSNTVKSFSVRNPNTSTAAVWVGKSTVLTNAGAGSVDLNAGQSASYELPNTNLIYCRVATGTIVLPFQGVN